jgi:hypothetical protein
MTELTFNALLNAAQSRAEEQRKRYCNTAALRDLSIAITAIEDALTRYNSAQYHERLTWKRVDPDMPETAADLAAYRIGG